MKGDKVSKRKKTFVQEAVATALANIQLQERRIQALCFAMDRPNEETVPPEVNVAVSTLYTYMYRRLHDYFRGLFMWGVVDDETRLLAAEIAHKYYFTNKGFARKSVMHWLERDYVQPGRYLVDDEKAFRAEIERLRKRVEEEKSARSSARSGKKA